MEVGKSVPAEDQGSITRQRSSKYSDPFFATTLERGLRVLAAFRPDDAWLSNSEISARTGMPRSSVSRLTNTLVQLGYLGLNESGSYRVGSQVLSVAYPLLARFKIRQIARPFMRDFAVRAGGNVSIAMSNDLNAIMLDVTRSDDTALPDYISDIGFSVPLYRTAIGRAILSLMSPEERAALHQRTLETAPQLADGKAEADQGVEDCKTDGFCFASSWRAETLAVAAPLLRTADGECLALVCAVPAFRTNENEMRNDVGPRLVSLAARIRALAGGA
ncbi:IclR family transcriptional regulator [Sphingobium sp. TA15]|uniref:IclR family transcriptional regulator n=4 Tax=Sphingobium indicum TaxID=332055 RepID=A0A8E1C4Z2_9SPHN|nr:IclR family transcriptional regulator [Sphingobium indicum B90A]EPR08981.1 IclR family transcriptional regulator [Sphingobium indicum IP26]EQB06886.1 IclR family transcriptional regulator [Sphingobium sp. HDIP04]KER38423.1 IclR family transcriptional regulator [Sphingobium indicum F2]RYM03431.1 IclR family transcriptional regulator [Sphingobium indicum]BAI97209.1 IclR-family putative transcriptional regulator [Sphingobium indicum UT26S]BDD66630.1 IclR family transcriptional regulator [Sphi